MLVELPPGLLFVLIGRALFLCFRKVLMQSGLLLWFRGVSEQGGE